MGRKSSTKKIVRELIKEKQEEEGIGGLLKKKKSKKDIKVEALKETKKKTKKTKKSKAHKRKVQIKIDKFQIYGAILTIAMMIVLLGVGYVVFRQAFRAQPVAKLLPEDESIYFVELTSSFEHNQLLETLKILEKYPDYAAEKMTEIFEKQFTVNFETEIQPWLGRKIGLATLHSKTHEGQINTIYFAETSNQNLAKAFISERASIQPYSGENIYLLADGKEIYFAGDYMFVTSSQDALKEIVDFDQSDRDALYSSKEYRRIENNLPFNHVAFAFINYEEIDDAVLNEYPALTEHEVSIDMVRPMLKLFNSEGFVLVALEDKFALQSFLNLNTDKLNNPKYATYQEKYESELAGYVSDEAMLFWGGRNLEYQMKRIIESLAGGDLQVMGVFDSVLQNYTNQFFGPEITLSNDIMPLFENEFAMAIEENGDKPIYKLLLEIEYPDKALSSLHDLFDNFAKVGAVYQQKVVSHSLDDGTTYQEIVAVPESVKRSKSMYKDLAIHNIKIGKNNIGFYYTVVSNYAVISNDIKGVKSSIDLIKDGGNNLRSSDTYGELIEPILRSSDEITYMNFDKLFPLLFKKEIPEVLLPITALSSGKNYFNDGITTINYLDIN